MSISQIGRALEETLLSSKKRILGSIVGLILLLAIPITVSLTFQRQDIRQRAAAGYGANGEVGYGGDGKAGYTNNAECGNPGQACCGTVGGFIGNGGCTCNDGSTPSSGVCSGDATHADYCSTQNQYSYSSYSCSADLKSIKVLLTQNGTIIGSSIILCPAGKLCQQGATSSCVACTADAPINTPTTAPVSTPTTVPSPTPNADHQYCTSNTYTFTACSSDGKKIVGNWGGTEHQISCEVPGAIGSCHGSNGCFSCTAVSIPDTPALGRTCASCLAAQPQAKYLCTTGQGNSASGSYCSAIDRSSEGDSCTDCSQSTSTDKIITFVLALPGVGPSTAAPSLGINSNPVHKTIPVSAFLLCPTNGTSDGDKYGNGSATFDSASGSYTGTVNLGNMDTSSTDKHCTITLKTPNSLTKRPQQTVDLGRTGTQSLGAFTLVTGDLNAPNVRPAPTTVIDVLDYNIFLSCMREEEACTAEQKALADLNDDGVIDAKDLNILLRAFATRQGE